MRLDPLYDAFYAIGSLWAALTAPNVCVPNGSAPRATVAVGPAAVTAFVDVGVVPMDTERVLPHQTVLIEGGRVIALGPVSKVQVPANAVRVDGRGKYLMPGLANMHPHGRLSEGQLASQETKDWLFSEIADGVTTSRQLVGGDLTPRQLEQYLQSPETASPRLYISPRFPGTDGKVQPSLRLDSVAPRVAAAKAAGYHHIGLKMSVEDFLRRDARTMAFIDSLIAAGRQFGLPIADHTHRLPLETTLGIGSTGGSVEHLSGVFWDSLGYWDPRLKDAPATAPPATAHVSKIKPIAVAMQRAGVWITPTLKCLEGHPWFTPAHDSVMRQIVKTMQDVGVGMFLSGDDGLDVHSELTELVQAGLTPYQALVTGTRNPAQYLHLLDSSGTVAVGKWADLVLLSGNPLADIRYAREPVGVMVAGRWLDRAALDQRLLASPKRWLGSFLDKRGIRNDATEPFDKRLHRLADSLAMAKSADKPAYERLVRQFADELGAMRAILAPEQYELFDPAARVWLRDQLRQGYKVAVPGLTLDFTLPPK